MAALVPPLKFSVTPSSWRTLPSRPSRPNATLFHRILGMVAYMQLLASCRHYQHCNFLDFLKRPVYQIWALHLFNVCISLCYETCESMLLSLLAIEVICLPRLIILITAADHAGGWRSPHHTKVTRGSNESRWLGGWWRQSYWCQCHWWGLWPSKWP